MAQFKAALVREQGVTFAVILVKNHVLNCSNTSDQMIQSASSAMGCPLVVLMGESNRKLRGSRQDVVNFGSAPGRGVIPTVARAEWSLA